MNSRRVWRFLKYVGEAVAFLGGIATIGGAAFPWASFHVFGMPVVLPGLIVGGAFTAASAAAGIALLRRVPFLTLLFGLLALYLGWVAKARVGKEVVEMLIHINLAAAPLNSRLAQVGVVGLDPVRSILPAATYLERGITITLAGAVAMAGGAALRIGADILSRRCSNCGYIWKTSRERLLHFCPRCGWAVLPAGAHACGTCHNTLYRRDKFCAFCGTPAGESRRGSRDANSSQVAK